jgi:predicted Holliday junction resolvase-like endonuclease
MGLIMEIIVILSLVVCILSYISYNLFKKVEKLERIVDSQDQYINRLSNTVNYTNKRLEDIDAKGTFQSDDEIGWFFESVKTLQRELNDFNINENNRNTQPTPSTNRG